MVAANLKREHVLIFLVMILISIILCIGFCFVYVGHEQQLYYWDNGAYWEIFKNVGQEIKNHYLSAPRIFLRSVRDNDYNSSAVFPLLPFYWIFGGARDVYVTSVAVLYLVPVAVIATLISLKSIGKDNLKSLIPIYIIAVSYTPFWAPTLRGYVDIVGLIFLGLATLLLFHSEFFKKQPVKTAIVLGILIWLPFLFRRWYAYSIVAFFISAFAFGLFTRCREEKFWQAAIRICVWLGLAGLVATICACSLQYGLVIRALTTSYADMYAAYQAPLPIHFLEALQRLGYYVLLLTALGTVILFLNYGKNNYGLFCLVSAVITFGLFIQTQQLGAHHFLPVAFWLFPAYVTGVEFLSRFVVFPKSGRLYPAAIISLAILYLSLVTSNSAGKIEAFFVPIARTPPLRIEKFSEYKRLTSDLEARLKERQHFAVFASSANLSDALLAAINPALRPFLSPAPHIAAQARFPFDILRSDYAVAATPPQTHMAPSTQVNITLPGKMLLENTGFGSAFEKVASYKLANGVTAYLFHRQRPVTPTEMKSLLDELETHYPVWKPIYDASMSIAFAAREIQLGDVWGTVSVVPPSVYYPNPSNTLYMAPGATTPTSVAIPIGGSTGERPLAVEVSISKEVFESCPNADGVELTIKTGSTKVWNGIITPGPSQQISLPQVDGTLEVIVDKRSQPDCDQVFLTFLFVR